MLLWCLLAVWVCAPLLVNELVVALYRRVKRRHAGTVFDDLPTTAGEWLRARLGAAAEHAPAAPPVRAIVTDDRAPFTSNCYHVGRRTIQLTDDTHFAAGPTAWAVAAHELGHAGSTGATRGSARSRRGRAPRTPSRARSAWASSSATCCSAAPRRW